MYLIDKNQFEVITCILQKELREIEPDEMRETIVSFAIIIQNLLSLFGIDHRKLDIFTEKESAIIDLIIEMNKASGIK